MSFTPLNNGAGASLLCSGVSSRVALPVGNADTMLLFNAGVTPIFVAMGNSTITATTACMAVPAGERLPPIGIPFAGGAGAPTYIAGITDGSFTATLVITLGNTT